MALPASGPISLGDVNVELDLPATAAISLSDAAVRTLFGVASGAISMSDGYGKSDAYTVTVSSNTADIDLESYATTAGWDGTQKLRLVVGSGVYVYTSTAGISPYALTIDGSFPNGVDVVNNGYIVGKGGAGGNGSGTNTSTATSGQSGGSAVYTRSAVSITNNGTIGGGGGGGAGGIGLQNISTPTQGLGGGGGGSGQGGPIDTAGGIRGTTTSFYDQATNGGDGTAAGAGSAGTGGSSGSSSAQNGGAGGTWGTNGSFASGGFAGAGWNFYPGSAASRGLAGYAVNGDSYVTWVVAGTRLGSRIN